MFLKMICQHCLTGCPLATVDNTSHLCLKGIVFTSNFWNFNFGETFSRKLVSAWKRPKPTGQVWVYHICGWMDSYQHMIERENINPSNDWKNIKPHILIPFNPPMALFLYKRGDVTTHLQNRLIRNKCFPSLLFLSFSLLNISWRVQRKRKAWKW